MTPEQVVRDFLNTFEKSGVPAATRYLADTMAVSVVNPPINGGRAEFIGQGTLLKEALPDYKWGVQQMTTQGNKVSVTARWTGTQTGVFRLSAFMPGAPDVPATGKKVTVPDHFDFTVTGDKITALHIDSGPNGGLPELLKQLGVQLPPMPTK
jgi:predicted ester cyclase